MVKNRNDKDKSAKITKQFIISGVGVAKNGGGIGGVVINTMMPGCVQSKVIKLSLCVEMTVDLTMADRLSGPMLSLKNTPSIISTVVAWWRRRASKHRKLLRELSSESGGVSHG